MHRLSLLILLIYGLILAGLATRQGALLLLALPLLFYLILSLLFRPRQIEVEISRSLNLQRVNEGQPIQVTVTVRNRGDALDSVEIIAPLPPGFTLTDGATRNVSKLPAEGSTTLFYTVQARRGAHQLPPLRIKTADRLGLFSNGWTVADECRVLVLPNVQSGLEIAVRPPRTRVYAGPIPSRRSGPGVEFYGVREYQPGDSRQWINHRITARHPQQIFVNQFEQERAIDVGLILDVRRSANLLPDGRSLLDHGVQAAAAMADTFLTAGNRVGLFLYGGGIDWTVPGYGKIQRERILQALARARLEEHQIFKSLAFLPTQLFPIRSQLVVISPLLLEDVEDLAGLRARGYELLIVAMDSVAFELQGLPVDRKTDLAVRLAQLERAQLYRQLQQAGARLFAWQVDTPFIEAGHRGLGALPHWRRGPE